MAEELSKMREMVEAFDFDELFGKYRDPVKFNIIQRKVINIYQKLKEDY